jgi:hypothetical protein
MSALIGAIPNPLARGSENLLVLRITPDPQKNDLGTVLDLTSYGQATDDTKRTWRLFSRDLGLDQAGRIANSPQPALPEQVQEGLRANLQVMDSSGDLPLWLNLIRPYGNLGTLPWEAMLGGTLERPVLRLPDFLERPRESADVLECAVIFDPPKQPDQAEAVAQLRLIVEQTLAASSRTQTRVNVFAGTTWHSQITGISSDRRVKVHPPDDALRLVQELRSQSGRPALAESEMLSARRFWLDWISAAVQGRSLDVVHFVGAALVTAARTGLTVANVMPGGEDFVAISLVDISDIGMTLTALGAWGAIFTASAGARDPRAMAFVADAVARSRPGTVLYHRADSARPDELRQALAFLFSAAPSQPPRLVDGFLYTQPANVAAHAHFHGEFALDSLIRNSQLVGTSSGFAKRALAKVAAYVPLVSGPELQQAPNWASAMQRYIESASLDQLRLNSNDVLLTKGGPATEQPMSRERTETVKHTLADIQAAAANYLRKSV